MKVAIRLFPDRTSARPAVATYEGFRRALLGEAVLDERAIFNNFKFFCEKTSISGKSTLIMMPLGKLLHTLRRQYTLIAGACLLVVILAAGTVTFTAYLKAKQIDSSSRAAKSLATILADETDRSIQSVSLIIARVAARLEAAAVDSPASLDQAASATEFRAFLHDSVAEDGSLDSIYVESGRTSADDDDRLTLTDIHARDQLSAVEDARPDAVYLSSPFRSRTTSAGRSALPSACRRRTETFSASSAGSSISPRSPTFSASSRSASTRPVSVIRNDGEIIACYPARELSLGSAIDDTPIFENLISKKRDGVSRQISDVDHIERMFAVVNSDRFPVASVVAVAMEDVLAAWRFEAQILEFGAAVMVVVILLGLAPPRLARRAACRRRANGRRCRRNRRSSTPDSTTRWTTSSRALAMYDKTGALIVCNRRYAEIYGLPIEIASLGPQKTARSSTNDPNRFGKADRQAAQGARRRRSGPQQTRRWTHHRPAQEIAFGRRLGLDP